MSFEPLSFEAIQGQAEAVDYLRGALARRRIPSAYLFLGPHNVGKRSTALALALALNCTAAGATGGAADGTAGADGVIEPADACGRCPSCRKIAEGVHPDVETVRPDGQFIKIDQVRAIADKLGLIPFEARKRVVIMAHAERMNPQAANALLKTLEEPPQDTLLVLCAERASALPETIVSRCVPVRFGLLPPETAQALLAREKGLSPDAADFAVRFAQGRLRPELPARAAHWLQLREELIGGLEGLQRPTFARLSEAIGRWAASEDWRFVLEWLESWFHDLAVLGAGGEAAPLINADRRTALEAQRRWFTPERAERCYRRVLAVREDILVMNANKALALEALWLGFKR